jgi:hypothetical protein
VLFSSESHQVPTWNSGGEVRKVLVGVGSPLFDAQPRVNTDDQLQWFYRIPIQGTINELLCQRNESNIA